MPFLARSICCLLEIVRSRQLAPLPRGAPMEGKATQRSRKRKTAETFTLNDDRSISKLKQEEDLPAPPSTATLFSPAKVQVTPARAESINNNINRRHRRKDCRLI